MSRALGGDDFWVALPETDPEIANGHEEGVAQNRLMRLAVQTPSQRVTRLGQHRCGHAWRRAPT